MKKLVSEPYVLCRIKSSSEFMIMHMHGSWVREWAIASDFFFTSFLQLGQSQLTFTCCFQMMYFSFQFFIPLSFEKNVQSFSLGGQQHSTPLPSVIEKLGFNRSHPPVFNLFFNNMSSPVLHYLQQKAEYSKLDTRIENHKRLIKNACKSGVTFV